MLALTALLWVVLTFQIGSAQSADPVECDFEQDWCNWEQDMYYDLSDWEQTAGYIIAEIQDDGEQTLARLSSEEFSYGNSPEISVRYIINGMYNAGEENTKLQVHMMHDGKMTLMTESDSSSGSGGIQTLSFKIDAGDTCEDSFGRLVLEAHIIRKDEWIAVDSIDYKDTGVYVCTTTTVATTTKSETT